MANPFNDREVMPPEESTGEGSPKGTGGWRRGIRRLLRNVELDLLWAGSAVSTFGTRTLGVAYPLLALVIESGSPIVAGWTGFALTIPILILYIPGGLLVDRIPPRTIMLAAEFVRGLAVGSVLLAMISGDLSLVHLMIAAAVEGAMWVLYTLAEASLLPSLAQPAGMRRILAKSEGAGHVGSLAGRPLGGYLFGLGNVYPFALNAALFAVSWGLFLSVRRPAERAPAEPSRPRDLLGGFRALMKQPFLRSSILLITITNLVVNTLMMVFVAGSHGLSSLSIGLVLAAGGVGGAVGAGLAFFRRPPRSVLLVHTWIWGVALSLAALGAWAGAWPIFCAAAFFVTGIGGAWSNVAIREVEVDRIDPGTLARVVGVSRLSAQGAICVAAPLGGLLVTWYGVAGGAAVLCAVMLTIASLVTISGRLREMLAPPLPDPLSDGHTLEPLDAELRPVPERGPGPVPHRGPETLPVRGGVPETVPV